MKKVSSRDDLLTKSYLKKALEPFATKKDLEKFATKTDIYRLENRVDDLEEKFIGKLVEFKDKILNAVDAVIKEVKAMREEQTAHSGQHMRISDEIENHEERIEKLEGHLFA